ncbi:MAG: AMP-binding protein [Candidatus Margulisiibacteriota bacterium]
MKLNQPPNPESLVTIKQMVEQNAARFAAGVAFQAKKDGIYQRVTYGEVYHVVESLAAGLKAQGVGRGDRIALLSENRIEWALAYLSIIYAGAVVVPLDAMITVESLTTILNESGARGIILAGRFLNMVLHARSDLPALNLIINLDARENYEGVQAYPRLVEVAFHSTEKPAEIKLDDLAAIVYTSGTTGIAKGVMLTHGNIMSNVYAVYSMFKVDHHDNFLSVLPLHHTFECTAGFLAPFYAGARITYAEGFKSYQLLANMQETGVTIMCGVPLMYRLFYDGIQREIQARGPLAVVTFGLLTVAAKMAKWLFKKNIGRTLFRSFHKKIGGKLRFWVAGAAATDPAVIHGFDVFGVTIIQGYGLTEASPIIAACTEEHNRRGSVGRPLSGVEVKIFRPDRHGIGEIIARGPNIMQGYYQRPDLTAEVIKDGWLYTGDLGYLDRDGYLFITGRSKDLIVTGSGVNVYPEEIEFRLGRIPLIKEACVLGLKLEKGVHRGGEEVLAVVFPDLAYCESFLRQKGLTPTREIIEEMIHEEIRKLNDRTAEFQRIMQTRIVYNELPKTSTRKVKRHELRKELGL